MLLVASQLACPAGARRPTVADSGAPTDSGALESGSSSSVSGAEPVVVPSVARPVSPLSGTIAWGRPPALRIASGSRGAVSVRAGDAAVVAGVDAVAAGELRVELCRTRACESPRAVPVVGGVSSPPADLEPGLWFWRVRDARAPAAPPAVWSFTQRPLVGAETRRLGDPDAAVRERAPSTKASAQLAQLRGIDIDGDGLADLVFRGAWLRGRRGGLREAALEPLPIARCVPPPGTFGCFGHGAATAVGDADGDGFGDVLVTTLVDKASASGADAGQAPAGESPVASVEVLRGGPHGLAADRAPLRAPTADAMCAPAVALGDVNGDGFADVATCRLLLGSATGLVPSAELPPTEQVFAAGDVDGDGFADVVVRERAGSALSVLYGSADGLARRTKLLDAAVSGSARVVAAGDVDGDGLADIVVATVSTAAPSRHRVEISVYGGPDPAAKTPRVVAFSEVGELEHDADLAVADLDGDGFDDIVFIPPWSRRNGRIVLGSTGALRIAPSTIENPVKVRRPAVGARSIGDIDGDGRDDLLVERVDELHGDPVFEVYLGAPGGLSRRPALELVQSSMSPMPVPLERATAP